MEKETGRSQKQTYTYDRKSDLAVKKKKDVSILGEVSIKHKNDFFVFYVST